MTPRLEQPAPPLLLEPCGPGLQTVGGSTLGTRLVQTARFRPRGLLGLGYWYAVLPFHGPVFDGLIAGIEKAATNEDEAVGPAQADPMHSSE